MQCVFIYVCVYRRDPLFFIPPRKEGRIVKLLSCIVLITLNYFLFITFLSFKTILFENRICLCLVTEGLAREFGIEITAVFKMDNQ